MLMYVEFGLYALLAMDLNEIHLKLNLNMILIGLLLAQCSAYSLGGRVCCAHACLVDRT